MTGRKTSLAVPIREIPASLHMKSQLLSKLWGKDVSENAIRTGAVDADAYLDYYVQQCDIFLVEQKRWLLSENDKALLMATHQDIVDVAEKVISGQLDRQGVVKEIVSHRASQLTADDSTSKHSEQRDGVVMTAVDWAVRLVTMLEIGQLQSVFQSREPPTWKHQSLKDYLAGVFVPGRPVIGHVRLEESFNVQSLQKLANLEIEWTNDLMSHLSLIDDDKKVLVFHHVTFLEAMNDKDLFPPGFCEETLRTIALLLPSTDKGVKNWYRKQQLLYRLDSQATKRPIPGIEGRQIDKFYFWRERLVILKQAFDEAEPYTISQWWYDRRRGPQWYTFWVAIVVLVLTVFFGLAQTIEGAVQVYLAWHS